MKQEWQYHVEVVGRALFEVKPQELEQMLDAAGTEGWELAALAPRSNSNRMLVVLRRRVGRPEREHRPSAGWP